MMMERKYLAGMSRDASPKLDDGTIFYSWWSKVAAEMSFL
jgi:hypothetical protein